MMSNSPNGFDNDPERASEAGKKSKRKPLDVQLAEYFETYIAGKIKEGDERTRMELMFEAAYKEFLKGNKNPLAYLMDRGFGRAKESKDITLTADIKSYDFSKLSKEDIKKLDEIESKIDR